MWFHRVSGGSEQLPCVDASVEIMGDAKAQLGVDGSAAKGADNGGIDWSPFFEKLQSTKKAMASRHTLEQSSDIARVSLAAAQVNCSQKDLSKIVANFQSKATHAADSSIFSAMRTTLNKCAGGLRVFTLPPQISQAFPAESAECEEQKMHVVRKRLVDGEVLSIKSAGESPEHGESQALQAHVQPRTTEILRRVHRIFLAAKVVLNLYFLALVLLFVTIGLLLSEKSALFYNYHSFFTKNKFSQLTLQESLL